MPANDLARKTAEIAGHDIGQRETDGQNDSPRIRVYGKTVGIAPPLPYCAAAVSTWVMEANQVCQVKPLLLKVSASALGLYFKNPWLRIDKEELTADDLPCIGVIDHCGGKGHAFLIVGMDDAGKLQTIEANSNGAGSREGQGVYALDIRNKADQDIIGMLRIQ